MRHLAGNELALNEPSPNGIRVLVGTLNELPGLVYDFIELFKLNNCEVIANLYLTRRQSTRN